MVRPATLLLMTLVSTSWGWGAGAQIDVAKVTVENRNGKDWCVLEAQVSMDVSVNSEALSAVILDFASYPSLDTKVKEIKADEVPGGTLLTERVVVNAFGIENVNRFTLRFVKTDDGDGPSVVHYIWTQEKTDGTIDSMEGEWVLESRGTVAMPVTRVIYRSRSAVTNVIFGQDTLLRFFMGGAYKDFVEAVAKKAVSK